MKKTLIILWILLMGVALAACGGDVSTDSKIEPTTSAVTSINEVASEPATEPPTTEPPTTEAPTTEPPSTEPLLDYATVKPDESGEIMIVMYHNLSNQNTNYARTVESFKGDLQRLNDMGFSTIKMSDYVNGFIDVPAGRTPVLLTFDDGHITNFKYLEQEDELVVDPESVVGILDAFDETYPEFGKSAVFYLNAGNPFGQPKYLMEKLTYLYENGYEIGNHAFDHEDLSTLDGGGIQRALGKNVQHFKQKLPQLAMETLALPYGKAPTEQSLIEVVMKGSFEEIQYVNRVALKVGWKPTGPVYKVDFNPSAVHRVQSGDGDMQLTWWLDQYEKSPDKRFISDGDPKTITVPREKEALINTDWLNDYKLNLYDY